MQPLTFLFRVILTTTIVVIATAEGAKAVPCDDIIATRLSPSAMAGADILPIVSTYLCSAPTLTMAPPYDAMLTDEFRSANCPPATSTLRRADARIIGIAALQSTGGLSPYKACLGGQVADVGWQLTHDTSTTTLKLQPPQAGTQLRLLGVYSDAATCSSSAVGLIIATNTTISCQNRSADASVTVFAEFSNGRVFERSYNDVDELTIPGCQDDKPRTITSPNPALFPNYLAPDVAFSSCVATTYHVGGSQTCAPQLQQPSPAFFQCLSQYAQQQCSGNSVPGDILACLRKYQCLHDNLIRVDQYEGLRLACKHDGTTSSCTPFSISSGNPGFNASPDVDSARCGMGGGPF